MTLPLIPTGFDSGNGVVKLSIFYEDSEKGYVSKIPNWNIRIMPKGALTKHNVHAKAIAFSLEYNGKIRYYGQDTLSVAGYQEIDDDKYKPDYIKQMFQACLLRWLTQHNIDHDWLKDKRLNIVSGMPPERYQDRMVRNKAFKAFSEAFNDKKPQYIKLLNSSSIVYFTAFQAITPETLSWRSVNTLKSGYTLLADLGFGTSDLCLFHSEQELPLSTKSINNGLLHSHNETNPTNPWLSELNTLRRVNKPEGYANITKAKIRTVARQLELTQLVVFGGGVKLLDKLTVADLKTYANNLWIGDEFTNVRNFMRLAK